MLPAMAYSLDLRKRVLAALERGMAVDEVVSTFQVGRSTIFRWQAQQRTTGTLAARTSPGRRRLIAEDAQAALRAQLEQQPDATLAMHVAAWSVTDHPPVSVATMARAIARVGWTRKKRLSTPVSKTSKHARSSESVSSSAALRTS
jgi:transposase